LSSIDKKPEISFKSSTTSLIISEIDNYQKEPLNNRITDPRIFSSASQNPTKE
jgi:hypothetical protein